MILVDPRTALYWPVDEQYNSVLPRDLGGGTAPPTIPAGLIRPPVVSGTVTGYGRDYVRASLPGILANDSSGQARLTRGLTIVAIVRLDLAALANGNICTLVQRGRGGGADPFAFRFSLEVVATVSAQVRLRLSWQTVGGVTVSDPGVVLTWPAGEYLMVAATREVVEGAFQVRYQANGESALVGAHALDCGGADTADVSLGMGMAGAAYQDHLDGVLDSLQVLDEAVTPEEFEWTWFRMSIHQPGGVEAIRRMVPRGVYSRDPQSRIQRELAVEGELAGFTKAVASRLRDYSMPDKAWGGLLSRWELLTGHSPKPGDHVQRRRDRVLSFLGTIRGFAIQDLKDQLADPFDLDPADVQILEYNNDYTQAFATDPANAVVTLGNLATLGVAGGILDADTGATGTTNKDLRYAGLGNPRAGLYVWSLGSGVDAWVHGKVTVAVATGEAIAGIALGHRGTPDDWVFIGVRAASLVALDVVRLKSQSGVLDATATVMQAAWNVNPTFFRLHLLSDGTIEVRWGSTDLLAKAQSPTVISPGIGVPTWAGFAMVSPGNFAAENGRVSFDDFFSHTPNGQQRFSWWAYRNPALAGNPDIDGARLLARRLKPAHTMGGATTVTALVCDDAGNGCEEGPIGS